MQAKTINGLSVLFFIITFICWLFAAITAAGQSIADASPWAWFFGGFAAAALGGLLRSL